MDMGSSSSQGYSPSSQLPPLSLRKEMTDMEWVARHRHQSSYFIQQQLNNQQQQNCNDNDDDNNNNNNYYGS